MFQSFSINERDFLAEAIKSNFRIDARSPSQFRPIDIKFGTENGQSLLKIGKTVLLTQSSLKLVTPQQGKPNEGFFKFNIEFSSLIHGSEYTNMTNTLSEMRVDISRFIDKVLKSSRAIDRESLCIVQGRLVWNVQVDIFLLNDDGNLMDACFLASVLALKNTRFPEVTISRDKIRINEERTKPLNVHHIPVCNTFYFIEDISKFIVDANSKEEKLTTSRLSICMNIFEDLCGMSTFGSLEIEPNQITNCMNIAIEITKNITNKVRQAYDHRATYQLLEFTVQKQAESILQENKKSAQAFLSDFFDQNPVDPADVQEEEFQQKALDKIKESKSKAKDNKAKPESKQKNSQKVEEVPVNNKESNLESKKRQEKMNEKLQKLKEIEGKDGEQLSLNQAVKSKKNKNK